MFVNVKPLDKKNHADLKFSPAADYAFARQLSNAPLVWKEMSHACKEYPIVFPARNETEVAAQEGPLPVALFSLVKNTNTFVDAKGIWQARYIPAYIRQYPFSLAKLSADGKYAVVIDEQAPQFSDQGEALFSTSGEPSDRVRKATSFLTSLQEDNLRTRRLTYLLEERQLLKPQQITYGEPGQQKGLRGFRLLDEKKLRGLDDALLAAWLRNGLLALVMAHLFSLGNIGRLAAGLGGAAPAEAAAGAEA
jgi:putative transposase